MSNQPIHSLFPTDEYLAADRLHAVKQRLAGQILASIESLQLSPAMVAEQAGISLRVAEDLLQGQVSQFTLEALLTIAGALDQRAVLTIRHLVG